MSTSVLGGFSQETFEALLQSRTEPDWLVRMRRAAWEQFQQLPMPARNHEEWRRTDIRGFAMEQFTPAAVAHAPVPVEANVAPPSMGPAALAGRLDQADGHVLHCSLDRKWSDCGVLFGPVDAFAAKCGKTIEPFLNSTVDPATDKFAALHAAFSSGGTLLYVPRDVEIDLPLCAFNGLTAAGLADTGHTLIVLEQGSSATLLHRNTSPAPDMSGLHVGGVEILVGPGARLHYVSLQEWGGDVWNFSHQRAVVEREGSLQWTIAAMGGRLAKVNQEVELRGRGAEAEIDGILFSEGRQHFSYHTRQHHCAAQTRSNLLYKGALKDHSRTVWRGMIRVDPDAQKTDAYQRNDNLLLSKAARADSIPGLEIEADDVRCTHGATAGRVDDDQIFYAACRGLTTVEAVQMIVEGFFGTVYDRIRSQPLRAAVRRAVAKKIGISADDDDDL